VLTRLNGIGGVASSSALLANVTKVVEEARSALRTEVPERTPALLDGKAAHAMGWKQDWRTIGQLNTIVEKEESSPQPSDKGYLWLALLMFLAVCAFLVWLLRRQRSARVRSEVRLGS
jgi:hypothetical protein